MASGTHQQMCTSLQNADTFTAISSLSVCANFFNDGVFSSSTSHAQTYAGLDTVCARYSYAWVSSIVYEWTVERKANELSVEQSVIGLDDAYSYRFGMTPINYEQILEYGGAGRYRYPPGSNVDISLQNAMAQPGTRSKVLGTPSSGKNKQTLRVVQKLAPYSLPGYPLASRTFWSALDVSGAVTSPPIVEHPYMHFWMYFDGGMSTNFEGDVRTQFHHDLKIKFYITTVMPRMITTLQLPSVVYPPAESKEEKKDDSGWVTPDLTSLSIQTPTASSSSSSAASSVKAPSRCTTPGHPLIGHIPIASCKIV